ncbi:MAG TPA: transporter substrate-binding domain-containing protein [Clostridiales bacterium]|jgi:polar amino acid transport system substrate-binding protein|nr:transporter substrate-binding domain-containing protein [Clostridiales bacterium]
MKKFKLICVLLAAVMLTAAAVSCGSSGKKYVVLEENFGSEQYGIGFRRDDNALTLAVQEAIDAMIADGTAAKISTDWFGEDKVLKDQQFPRAIENTGDDSLQKILDKGEIILGLDVGFKPMGFYDDAGNIVGFDIDLAKEVASRLGVALKLQPIDWNSKEMELSAGNIDMIWNGMSITPERAENMNISKPYLNNRMVIIAAADSGIAAKADLSGKKVAVQAGSSALDCINAEPDIAATFTISEYPDNPTAFLDLKAGRVDALVVDEVVGLNLISEDK